MASYKGAEIHFDDASIERRFAFFPRGNDMANEQVSEQRLDQLIVREAGTEAELALRELKARRGGLDNWKTNKAMPSDEKIDDLLKKIDEKASQIDGDMRMPVKEHGIQIHEDSFYGNRIEEFRQLVRDWLSGVRNAAP